MRTLIRARARTLVAGLGVFLVSSLTGCWSTKEPAPLRGPMQNQNIPRTNVNGGPGNPAGSPYGRPVTGQPGAMTTSGLNNPAMTGGGQPISRISGAPLDPAGRVNMTSAALGSAAGGPVQLGPPPGSGQPIASNAGVGRPIQPVGYNAGAAAALTELDPVPSAQNPPRERELPPVRPISTQDMYQNRTWQKKSPPEMPVEHSELPMPTQLPKIRNVEPLAPPDTLMPPPK